MPSVTLGGGEPLLTAEAPRSERHLSLVVAPKKARKGTLDEVSLYLEVEPVWSGLSGGAWEVQPWLRIRVVDERDGHVFGEQVVVAGRADGPFQVRNGDVPLCEKTPGCEVPLRLEFERQGAPAGGSVELRWEATVDAASFDTDGENFQLSFSEP